ncbi:hypothetical protein [Streptomyces sp. CC228A]|uniref:hypothetical protein n=1 Tax=Streptomyces sp. CC228A TaxID=2898186 RepID=UPI001F321280|nr:hypothetical protein [Streptomyces sp. CC228A]
MSRRHPEAVTLSVSLQTGTTGPYPAVQRPTAAGSPSAARRRGSPRGRRALERSDTHAREAASAQRRTLASRLGDDYYGERRCGVGSPDAAPVSNPSWARWTGR